MNEGRDLDLGRRIAALPTPDHGRDFWTKLDDRLAEETVDEVAERRARRGRGWQGLLPLITVAALIVALLGYVGTRSTQDDPAGEERVDTRPSSDGNAPPAEELPQIVTGVVEVLERPDENSAMEATQEYTFVRVIDGSYAVKNNATNEFMGYDAARARTMSWYTFDGKTSVTIEENVAPGSPDRYPYSFLGGHDIEDFVVSSYRDRRSLPGITEVEHLGRPAIRFNGAVRPNELAGNGVNGLDITVDKQTGVLLRLVEKADGVPVREVAVRTLEVDVDVARSGLLPEPPPGATVETTDQRFRKISVDELSSAGVIAPLYPERSDGSEGFGPPEPFELDSVWVNVEGGGITGPEGSNPGSARVASLLYRDGWRRVVVTLRALNGPPDNWSDPFGGEGQRLDDQEEFVLEADGAFAGAEGFVVVDPQTVPHAWAISCGDECTAANDWPGYVLTAAGAATAEELKQFATVAIAA